VASVAFKRYDVLVVGAGVIGLSIGYHIKHAHPDLSVLIVDRKSAPAQGDTAKSMAAVRDTFTSDVNRLLSSSSINFYKHVQTQLGFHLDLELIGYLWLLTESQFKSFEAFALGMTQQGIRFKVLEPREFADMIPDLVLNPTS
jgi:FAD-dependent oxidoreductase domain-containing protein 1